MEESRLRLRRIQLRLLQLWTVFAALTLKTAAQSGGCNSVTTTAAIEVDALLEILRNFEGSTNVTLPGWGAPVDPCGQDGTGGFGTAGAGWAGVVCQTISNGNCATTVSGLQLTDMNIKGILSQQIQNLKNLTILNIAGNPELTGPIPDGLGSLEELVMLDLHGNAFTGNVPHFENLRRLQFLDLSENQINGSIPAWLGSLRNLQKLDLSSNLLEGRLPLSSSSNVTGLNNLTFVVQMSLSNNNLNGSLDGLSTLQNLRILNGSNNHFEGTFFTLLQMPQLAVLDLSSNDITGPVPDVSALRLTEIYMAYNNLSGTLSSGFLNSSTLQFLDLDNNSISGSMNLQALNMNSSLQLISLLNNDITAVQFPENMSLLSASNLTAMNSLFLSGNPCCNDPHSEILLQICRSNSNQILITRTRASSRKLLIILLAIAGGLMFMFASALVLFCIIRKLSKKLHVLHNIQQEFAKRADVQPHLYSYSELKIATEDFSSEMRLGQGGFGVVYKGIFSNDTEVAIKQLSHSDQELIEFLNEIVTISNVRHQNLVKLKGCCIKGVQRLLVCEYVENKNLAEALWDAPSKGGQNLDWSMRFNIILGVARGLEHLHNTTPPIIHRDLKASNILLDKDLNPKIGDFGLALLFPTFDEDRTHQSGNIAGTKGYLAPEYASLGQVSEKADVFSFGILVLEIISGRKNINLRLPAEQRYILEWAWKLYEADAMSEFIDPKLVDTSKEEDIKQAMRLGLACVQYAAERRPPMSDVLSILLGNKVLDPINRDSELSKGELEAMFATMQTSSLTPVDEDSPLLVGLPTASASGAFIELGKLKPR